jgi:hypothetical protein
MCALLSEGDEVLTVFFNVAADGRADLRGWLGLS